MHLESALKEVFVEKKMRLALAESCTGGAMAAMLTRLSGASNYFLGSVVAYSNEMKQKLLRVSSQTLERKGAVSKEVAIEMLEGLFAVTSADWGVAVSGIAGPSGGSVKKPVGTVYVAIGCRGKEPECLLLQLNGAREIIIQEAVRSAFEALLHKVS